MRDQCRRILQAIAFLSLVASVSHAADDVRGGNGNSQAETATTRYLVEGQPLIKNNEILLVCNGNPSYYVGVSTNRFMKLGEQRIVGSEIIACQKDPAVAQRERDLKSKHCGLESWSGGGLDSGTCVGQTVGLTSLGQCYIKQRFHLDPSEGYCAATGRIDQYGDAVCTCQPR